MALRKFMHYIAFPEATHTKYKKKSTAFAIYYVSHRHIPSLGESRAVLSEILMAISICDGLSGAGLGKCLGVGLTLIASLDVSWCWAVKITGSYRRRRRQCHR